MESKPERGQPMNETITIEQGSGNVFADLGYPNAEEALIEARLAQRITEAAVLIMERNKPVQ
jgi:hypothetical protein